MGQKIEDLATFIAGGRWEDVPGNIQARVKYALLDTVGVILAGSLRPEVQSLRAALLKNGGQVPPFLRQVCKPPTLATRQCSTRSPAGR